jgi:carbon storage regulator
MLILQRRAGESVRIGDDIEITVVATEGGRVRLSISAPKEITILRSELIGARETNLDAAMKQVAPTELLTMLDGLLPAHNQAQTVSPVKLLSKNEINKQ